MVTTKNKTLYYLGIILLLATFVPFYFIFFAYPEKTFLRIPITFDSAEMPLLKTKIEKNSYWIKLDLGSKFQMTLSKSILNSLNKTPHAIAHWRDSKGNFYEAPSFSIPKIVIGETFALTNFIAVQKNDNHEKNTTIWDDDQNAIRSVEFGSLGRPLLEKTNLLLDFPHSAIFLCKDNKSFEQTGISLEEMTKVPFEKTLKGMIIKTETNQGSLRLLIDTCSTVSIIRASLLENLEHPKEKHGFSVFTSSQFVIGDKNFGKQKFLLYDLASELQELDGVLGMDFLKTHLVYIDYSNTTIFIGE